MEIKNIFYITIPLKYGLEMEFTACKLLPEGALASFTVCDAYR